MIGRLVEATSALMTDMCSSYSGASDSSLEDLIAAGIQEDLRIIKKLKSMRKP